MKITNLFFIIGLIYTLFSCRQEKDTISTIETNQLAIAIKHPSLVISLDLSNQHLTEFPKEILKMENLELLILSSNQLTQLPEDLSELKSLKFIELNSNNFHEIPVGLSTLPQLELIDLSENLISSVDLTPHQFKHLLELNLACNPIRTVSEGTWSLPVLDRIDLSGTLVCEIPVEKVSNLKYLTHLFLSNYLSKASKLLIEKSKLDSLLVIHYISIAEYQARKEKAPMYDKLDTDKTSASKVLYLDLSNQSLTEIPKELRNYSQLKRIDLSGNSIQALNTILMELPNLESIDLAYNQLVDLDLSKLPLKLKYLDVSYNKIDLIKGEFSQFTALQYLFLYGNELHDFSTDNATSTFKWLGLSSNPLVLSSTDLAFLANTRILVLPEENQTKLSKTKSKKVAERTILFGDGACTIK